MLDVIFMQVLDMTKIASVVIPVVILARRLLRKAPKIFSYMLWAVVLFRLLCPVSLKAPVSIVPQVSSVAETYSLAEESISVLGAGEAAYRAVGDVLNGGLGIQHIRTTETDADGTTKYVSTDWWDVWILFGQYVWIAGVAVMLLYSVASYLKLKKKLMVTVPLRENIYIADDIRSPFVIGLRRPKIYLPCGLDEKEQEYIILHEQYHIRRMDHVVKALAFLALCIHWFNPLVWAAFVLANKDMEMSCDEAVIRKSGEEIRADYSASLLSLATGHRIIAGTPLAFGEGDTKGRIKNLANWKKPAFWVVIAAVVGCVVLAVCLLTDPAAQDSEDKGLSVTESTGMEFDPVILTPDTVVMKPTDVDIQGAFDSYLYVPLDGWVYRYERTEAYAENFTVDKLLYHFTETATPASVNWAVYSLEEYPGYEVVLAVAGSDYKYLYEYSPSKRSDPDALQQAKDNGCVVMEDGDVTFGQQTWQDFVDATEAGKSASVQVGHYYTLNPERCSEEYYQVYQEDYPVIYILNLSYDGSSYTLRWNEGSREYVMNYKYLMHYTGDAPTAGATYDTYDRYVLTNDNTVSWEDLMHGVFSSQLGDYIDHHSVYTDLQ